MLSLAQLAEICEKTEALDDRRAQERRDRIAQDTRDCYTYRDLVKIINYAAGNCGVKGI